MKKFDLKQIETFGYAERQKNVFYEKPEFKIRIISLEAGEIIPECQMGSYVIFFCLEGKVAVNVNGQNTELGEQQLLVSEPGVYSMKTVEKSRLLGIQVKPIGARVLNEA
ncbi:MAG: cupin domain-containing protein [Candidatus Saccharicenans sp.]|nr:MAG: hypothetical protein C0168_02415 [Candidatus Aminicenantes bacterium]